MLMMFITFLPPPSLFFSLLLFFSVSLSLSLSLTLSLYFTLPLLLPLHAWSYNNLTNFGRNRHTHPRPPAPPHGVHLIIGAQKSGWSAERTYAQIQQFYYSAADDLDSLLQKKVWGQKGDRNLPLRCSNVDIECISPLRRLLHYESAKVFVRVCVCVCVCVCVYKKFPRPVWNINWGKRGGGGRLYAIYQSLGFLRLGLEKIIRLKNRLNL